MKPFVIHPEARAEFDAAVAYYEGKREGLGGEFREEVEAALAAIQRTPKAFSPQGDEARKFILKRFPYNIIYRELDEVIQIVAIAHQKRKPGYWLDRIND